jgi:spore maturation protein CgeB
LNRSRIVLSLLRVPHDLAGMRVLMGMACRALVVSEYCKGTGAYVPGEHFVMAPLNQLPETIVRYLDHESERERIASAGHRFVTEELTLQKALAKMLA